jgi:hypothetical protein
MINVTNAYNLLKNPDTLLKNNIKIASTEEVIAERLAKGYTSIAWINGAFTNESVIYVPSKSGERDKVIISKYSPFLENPAKALPLFEKNYAYGLDEEELKKCRSNSIEFCVKDYPAHYPEGKINYWKYSNTHSISIERVALGLEPITNFLLGNQSCYDWAELLARNLPLEIIGPRNITRTCALPLIIGGQDFFCFNGTKVPKEGDTNFFIKSKD